MTDTPQGEGPAPVKHHRNGEWWSKLVTVQLGRSNSLAVNIDPSALPDVEGDLRNLTVAEILRKGAVKAHQDQEHFSQENMKMLTAPINQGALYDDIIFEVAIYLNDSMGLHMVPSFGRLLDSSMKMSDAMLFLANALNHAADHLAPAAPAPGESGPGDEFAGRF